MYLENLITSFPVAKYKFIIQPKEDIIFSKISTKNITSHKRHKIVNINLKKDMSYGTYKDIQEWIKEDNFGISVKTCWVADVKERCGLSVKRTPNRQGV
jgi:hypothetical protein